VNLAKDGLLMVDTTAAAFAGTMGRNSSSGFQGQYIINSGLKGALNFFAKSGPERTHDVGHLTFRNDAPEWRTLQSGGTLLIRVVSENTAQMQQIDYGLILKVKGGLVGPDNASLDLELELSTPIPKWTGL